MSPFLPGNKIILNEENDDNPEIKYTTLSEKDDMSHNSTYDLTEKQRTKKYK